MDIYDIIKHPIVTEKAESLRENNVYVFKVDLRSNKKMVSQAIEKIFNVKPKKVNMAKIPRYSKVNRYGTGRTSVGKKAFVYLNKKDKIEIFEGV
ncbi:MAG: 50S ribosomal protein L23 [Spirochaetia bacterium]|nr:50S ribosomal protein L23 [Spirochaetia bacterium]